MEKENGRKNGKSGKEERKEGKKDVTVEGRKDRWWQLFGRIPKSSLGCVVVNNEEGGG
jgi:hypothetical protein